MEERYHQLLKRIEKLDQRITHLTQVVKEREVLERIKEDLYVEKVFSFKFYTVPKEYYDFSLDERARILNGSVPQLCKSIIFENTACSHSNHSDPTDSRFYLVVIQYQGERSQSFLISYVSFNFMYSFK
jgi:hypothetical protein